MKAIRNLKLVALALLVLFLLGTIGFHLIEGWPWFDSFYMVLITVTTIGYTEVHPLSHAGQFYNVFVIVIGVGLVFLLIGVVAQALLEFELTQFFGRRRMEREIDRLDGHFIVCGKRAKTSTNQLQRVPEHVHNGHQSDGVVSCLDEPVKEVEKVCVRS